VHKIGSKAVVLQLEDEVGAIYISLGCWSCGNWSWKELENEQRKECAVDAGRERSTFKTACIGIVNE
jgi:hypothetical protein